MFVSITFLILSLIVILIAAEGFTNGVEVFGRKLNLSQAVVGSILAAVGTALPETILPIVAIAWGAKETAQDIGVGAILGAPFMLSTLAFFLVGLTALFTFLAKKRKFEIKVETLSLKRDLIFFILMYSLAVFSPLFLVKSYLTGLAILLVLGYFFYVYLTVNSKSKSVGKCDPLYVLLLIIIITKNRKTRETHLLIVLQIILSLIIMVAGAKWFVNNLEVVSLSFGFSPLLFALIFAPVATELPEKFNSISWTLKGKDSLAIGNITGAMVFQTTFPVCVGLLFTDWKLTNMAVFSAVIALTSAFVVLAEVLIRKKISPYSILFGGVLYIIYIVELVR